jgi:exodeoxyribonuclease VII small subunit
MKNKIEKAGIGYEEALNELEEIREALEEDLVSVDLLSEKVKRAYELIAFCKKKLFKTEEELNAFTNNEEE